MFNLKENLWLNKRISYYSSHMEYWPESMSEIHRFMEINNNEMEETIKWSVEISRSCVK